MGFIQSMIDHLEIAKCCLQVLQSKGVDGLDAERKQASINKLQLMIRNLQGEVEYDGCVDALTMLQKDIDPKELNLKAINVRLGFVTDMQLKKKSILLQVPPPKAPTGDATTFGVFEDYTTCGVLLCHNKALGMFMLPCMNAYHIYYFAHVAHEEGSCMATRWNQVFSQNIKDLIYVDSGDNSHACTKIGKYELFFFLFYMKIAMFYTVMCLILCSVIAIFLVQNLQSPPVWKLLWLCQKLNDTF